MLRYLFPPHLRQWAGPSLVAAAGALLLAIAVVVSGAVDLAATRPHPLGWAGFLHYTFRRSTARHAAGVVVPAHLDQPAQIAAGALYYATACAHCHGAPGFGQNPVALAMTPRPQYLPHAIGGLSAAQLFRIVRYGVKYTAMPGWPAQGRDDEVWRLVAYLRAQPRMTGDQFLALAKLAPGDGATIHPFGAMPAGAPFAMRGALGPQDDVYAYTRPAFGFDSFALTQEPTQTCARCHGADGGGGGVVPGLALQDPVYLRDQLEGFAKGLRRSAYMQTVAVQLSPAQIDALAGFYAAKPRRRADALAVLSPSVAATGSALALSGVPSRKIAACSSCHGITSANGKASPRLEGQARLYLADQLVLFRKNGRGSAAPGDNPMAAIARKLTLPEIDALAQWYAAQPPVAVQAGAVGEGVARRSGRLRDGP